jgi:ketosteroid isomerase-like protein
MPITKKEIEDAYREELSAWDSHDMEAVDRINAEAIGLGFRSISWRDHRINGEEGLRLWNEWIAAHEYYNVELEEIHTSVEGDIGLAWGFHIEDFKCKGQPPEWVRVRFSVVYKKKDENCIPVLYHRDIQPFDETGKYLPEFKMVSTENKEN